MITFTHAPVTREAFFNAYWASLSERGWAHVILHSWKHLPDAIDSDIDYAITGVSSGELLRYLAEFCKERHWRLAQVIEHEPGAFFCACVQRGGNFDILALDVTWDYRRLGHILIPSDVLHDGSRSIEGKVFRVPAPGAEAAYILAKAAAKGKSFADVKQRLFDLIQEDPVGCHRALSESFGCVIPPGLPPKELATEIERWYPQASAFRPVRKGRRLGIREIRLYLGRISRPTGLWLRFHGQEADAAIIGHITKPLIPLFRRTYRRRRISSFRIPEVISYIIRTSLVIECEKRATGSCDRCQISVDLSRTSDAREASCQILDKLAARVERRLSVCKS